MKVGDSVVRSFHTRSYFLHACPVSAALMHHSSFPQMPYALPPQTYDYSKSMGLVPRPNRQFARQPDSKFEAVTTCRGLTWQRKLFILDLINAPIGLHQAHYSIPWRYEGTFNPMFLVLQGVLSSFACLRVEPPSTDGLFTIAKDISSRYHVKSFHAWATNLSLQGTTLPGQRAVSPPRQSGSRIYSKRQGSMVQPMSHRLPHCIVHNLTAASRKPRHQPTVSAYLTCSPPSSTLFSGSSSPRSC